MEVSGDLDSIHFSGVVKVKAGSVNFKVRMCVEKTFLTIES